MRVDIVPRSRMPLDYDRLMSSFPREDHASYSRRDVILYALGLGIGSDEATSAATLRFTYEADLHVLPTMAVVIGYPGFWLNDPKFGLDSSPVFPGETLRTEIWREQPGSAALRVRALERDVRVIDNGFFEYSPAPPVL